MESKEWTAKADEELQIPAEYLEGLKYEILVLSSKKVFSFRCTDYAIKGQVITCNNAIMDTSKRNARGDVTLQRVSYHDKIHLINVGCMAIPIPESEVSSPQAD